MFAVGVTASVLVVRELDHVYVCAPETVNVIGAPIQTFVFAAVTDRVGSVLTVTTKEWVTGQLAVKDCDVAISVTVVVFCGVKL